MVLERVLRRGVSAWAHAAAGLAISVVFGWLAIRDVSGGSVRASLEHIDPAWLIAALALLAVAVVMRSERWRLLFPAGARPPLRAVFWSLAIVVTVKYVVLILRADNNGEGGVLALAALAHRSSGMPACSTRTIRRPHSVQTAIAMPMTPRPMPRRACLGELNPCSARMKQTEAMR